MSKAFVLAAVAFALVAAPSAFAAPGGQGPARTWTEAKTYCPSGPNVIYVNQYGLTEPDVGLQGNTWAGDVYQRTISVVRVAPNTYCAATRYSGTFTSIAGLSPSGLGWVGDGDTAPFYGGTRSTVFTASWSPIAPTSGTTWPVVDWKSLYFTGVQGYDLMWWTFSYYGGTYGYWQNQATGSSGDITG
jgi:hypothetical protein